MLESWCLRKSERLGKRDIKRQWELLWQTVGDLGHTKRLKQGTGRTDVPCHQAFISGRLSYSTTRALNNPCTSSIFQAIYGSAQWPQNESHKVLASICRWLAIQFSTKSSAAVFLQQVSETPFNTARPHVRNMHFCSSDLDAMLFRGIQWRGTMLETIKLVEGLQSNSDRNEQSYQQLCRCHFIRNFNIESRELASPWPQSKPTMSNARRSWKLVWTPCMPSSVWVEMSRGPKHQVALSINNTCKISLQGYIVRNPSSLRIFPCVNTSSLGGSL